MNYIYSIIIYFLYLIFLTVTQINFTYSLQLKLITSKYNRKIKSNFVQTNIKIKINKLNNEKQINNNDNNNNSYPEYQYNINNSDNKADSNNIKQFLQLTKDAQNDSIIDYENQIDYIDDGFKLNNDNGISYNINILIINVYFIINRNY